MAIDANDYLERLGKKIAHHRNEKGMTQYKLAKALFMEQSNLARIENGATNPTVKTLAKICNALEIKMDELVMGVEDFE